MTASVQPAPPGRELCPTRAGAAPQPFWRPLPPAPRLLAAPGAAALPNQKRPALQARRAVAEAHDPAEREAEQLAHKLAAERQPGPRAPETPLPVVQTRPLPTDPELVPDSGEPLAQGARQELEARLGYGLQAVRIHRSSAAARLAHQHRAEAYTAGPHIVFAAGRYAPQNPDGKRLLLHELVHVVQQGHAAPISPRLAITARPAAGVLLRDAAPHTASAKVPPAPEKPAAPVEVPLDLAYISQRPLRSSIPGNDYLDHAAQFYQSKGRVDNFLELFRAIYSKLPQAKASDKARPPKRAYVRELTLVVHGWPNGDILFGIDHRDRSKTNFPNALPAVRGQLQADDSRKEVYSQVRSAMDNRTRVILRACSIGGNPAALAALGTLFGGKATVFAPRVYSVFEAQIPVAISYFPGQEPPSARNRTGPIVFASRKLIERVLRESGRQARDDYDLVALCIPVPFEKNGQAVANLYFLPTSYLSKRKNPTLSDAAALRQNSHFIPSTGDNGYWGHSTPDRESPAQPDSAKPAAPEDAEAPVPSIAAPASQPEVAEPAPLPAAPSPVRAGKQEPAAPSAQVPAGQPAAAAAALQTSKGAELVPTTSQVAEETEPAPAPLHDELRLSSEREWLRQKAAILHSGFPGDFAAVQKEVYERLAQRSPSEVRALAGLLSDPPGMLLRALLRDAHLLDVRKYRLQLAGLLAVAYTVLPDYPSTPFASTLVNEVLKPRDLGELPVQWVATYARTAAAVASADKDIFKDKQYTYSWFRTLYVALPEAEREKFLDQGGNKLQQLLWGKLSQGERETLGLNLIDPQSSEKLRLKVREQILAAQDPQQAAADPATQKQRQKLLLLLASTVGDSRWAKEQLSANDKDFADTLLTQRALDRAVREPSSGRHSVANLAKALFLRLENLDLASLPSVLDLLAGVRFAEAGPHKNVVSLRRTGDFETRNGKSKLVKTRGINVDIPGLALAALSVPLGAGKLQTGAANFGHIGIDFLSAGAKATPQAQIDVAVESIDIKELVYLSPGLLIAVGDTRLEGSGGKDALVLHATLVGPGPQDSDEILQSGLIEKFVYSLFKGLASATAVAMGIVQVSSLSSNLIERGHASLDLNGKATLSVIETSEGIGVDKAEVRDVKAGLGEATFFSLAGIDLFGVHGAVSAEKIGASGLRADTNRSFLSKLLDPATLRELVRQSVVAGDHSREDVDKGPSAAVKSTAKTDVATIESITAKNLRLGSVPTAKELVSAWDTLRSRRQQLVGYVAALDRPQGLINDWVTSVQLLQSFHDEQLRLRPGRRNLVQRQILAEQIGAVEAAIDGLRLALKPFGFGEILKATDARKALKERATALQQRITDVDAKIVEVYDREAQRVEYQRLLALPKLSAEERQQIDALRRAFRSPLVVEELDLQAIELSVGLSQEGAPQQRYERSFVGVTATVAALDVSGLPAEQLALILRGRRKSLAAVAEAKVRALTPAEEQEARTLEQALAEYKALKEDIELTATETQLNAETSKQSSPQQIALRAKRQALIDWSRAVVLKVRGLSLTAQVQLGDLLSDDDVEAAARGAANAKEKLSRVDRLLGGGVHAGLSLPAPAKGAQSPISLVKRTKDEALNLAQLDGAAASFDVQRSGKDILIQVRKVSVDALSVEGIAWSDDKDQFIEAGKTGLSKLDFAAQIWLYDKGDIKAEIKNLAIDELYAAGLRAHIDKLKVAAKPEERARLHGIYMHDFVIDRFDDGRPLQWSGSAGLRGDEKQSGLDIPSTFVQTTLAQLLSARATLKAGSLQLRKDKSDGTLAASAKDVQLEAVKARYGTRTKGAASLGLESAAYTDDGKGKKTIRGTLEHLKLTSPSRYGSGGLLLELGADSELTDIRISAELTYQYDRRKGEEVLREIRFAQLAMGGLTVRNGFYMKDGLKLGLPHGILADLHVLGAKLTWDQLGRMKYQGQLDLRGGFYLDPKVQVAQSLAAAATVAASSLRITAAKSGEFIIDRFERPLLQIQDFSLKTPRPLSLHVKPAYVTGLRFRQLKLRLGTHKSVELDGGHISRIHIAGGFYEGPVITQKATPGKTNIAYENSSRLYVNGDIDNVDVGHARADLDHSLLLQQFGIGKISIGAVASTSEKTEEDSGSGRSTTESQSGASLFIDSDGFSADAIGAYLGHANSGQGSLAYTRGFKINPIALFVGFQQSTGQKPGNPIGNAAQQAGSVRAQISGLTLKPDIDADGHPNWVLSNPNGGSAVTVSGLNFVDPAGLFGLNLREATIGDRVDISQDFKDWTFSKLDLQDADLRLTRIKPPPTAYTDAQVTKTQTEVEALAKKLDVLTTLNGDIDLEAQVGKELGSKLGFSLYRTNLRVEDGVISVPSLNAMTSPALQKLHLFLHAGGLAVSIATLNPLWLEAANRVAAGVELLARIGSKIVLGFVVFPFDLRGGLKFLIDGKVPYSTLLHLILDDKKEPSSPLPIQLLIRRSSLSLNGSKALALAKDDYRFDAQIGKNQIDLEGRVNQHKQFGEIATQINLLLHNLKFQSSALGASADLLKIEDLAITLGFQGGAGRPGRQDFSIRLPRGTLHNIKLRIK